MFPRGKTSKRPLAMLAALLVSMLIVATICFADKHGEKQMTMIIRPKLLSGVPATYSNILGQSRNPFIWSTGHKARLDQLDGSPRPDPFEELTLNGIIWVSGTPIVIIDDKQLRKGDTIKGIEVKKITKDSVVLSTKKAHRTLRFPSSEIDFSPPPSEVE